MLHRRQTRERELPSTTSSPPTKQGCTLSAICGVLSNPSLGAPTCIPGLTREPPRLPAGGSSYTLSVSRLCSTKVIRSMPQKVSDAIPILYIGLCDIFFGRGGKSKHCCIRLTLTLLLHHIRSHHRHDAVPVAVVESIQRPHSLSSIRHIISKRSSMVTIHNLQPILT